MDQLTAAAAALRAREPVSLSELRIPSKVLMDLFQEAPVQPDGKRVLPPLDLGHSVLEGDIELGDTVFAPETDFSGVTFEGLPSFRSCEFLGAAAFSDARFTKGANFSEARTNWAEFRRVLFGDRADFDEADFKVANFEAAEFAGEAIFRLARFGSLLFRKTRFVSADFSGVMFEGGVTFTGARWVSWATFADARFNGVVGGALNAAVSLDLESATFLNPVNLTVYTPQLSLEGAQFPAGGELRIRGPAQVLLDHTTFGKPLLITGSDPERRESPSSSLVSLRWADVRNLVLAEVDLRSCRFVNAHNLHQLRLEGDVMLASAPNTRLAGFGRLWSRRHVLAEEHQWRAARWGRSDPPVAGVAPARIFNGLRRRDWYPDVCRLPEWFSSIVGEQYWPGVEESLPARYVANIYRDLRRGREQAGDEPGAADFYYGEMEMRRFDRERPWAERVVLFLYWLVSGYGLRATRAITALAVTIIGFALLLWWVGFDPRPGFARALLFSAESTSNLFRTPRTPNFGLTGWGEATQIPLRLLGPLFFGLALLSLRGRVKR